MKFNVFFLVTLLMVSTTQSFATNVDKWVFENTTGDLKPTPGCKNIEKAKKQASSGYRFKKYTTILCNDKGYGWGLEEVLNKGEVVCDECEGEEYEGKGLYRCSVKNVELKCRQVVR